jgi:tetratricopeptide (TPR) repeat protein
MATSPKRPNDGPEPPASVTDLARMMSQSQLDFEIDFYGAILARRPDFVDVLRAHASNLTTKGLYQEGLRVDQRLIQLRPKDALAHYNLACSLALLKNPDQAIKMLRKAVELGYRDFRYMKQDSDLESIRRDPRFKQLLREYENR